ncbi:sodium/proline symporter PutP [Intestinibacter sp.]|uniref:sodium/proline symporter PutP n=1 Tax=Intestinibacter sp. TaxID=1965304 RepID=UPI002A9139A9|nr:sodium/proline symporter PutP [Intestinibacter sp.]MDY5212761.1 sodium/proline symporter PutP [Intestinibacter sp.]
MVQSNLTIIVIFVLYLVMMLTIGLIAYKKTSNTEDYFLGGRKLGSWVVSLSAQASDMSGWMLMGLPGAAYIAGLEAGWIALGLTIGTYFNWKLVAKRIRNYTEVCNAITIPQFLGNRYRDEQNILRIVSSLFILIFFLVYTASAFVSGGKLFSTVFGIDYTLALLICAVVVVSYTYAGGFFAVCWTDLIQGILMFIAIVIVPCAAVVSMGGIGATIARIESININMLDPFVTLDGTHITMITVISSLAWGLGYFGQPHILVRFMGIDNAKSIKKSRLIAMVWVIFSLTAATMVGLLGRVFLTQDLSNSSGETVYILMVMKIFPLIIAGIFLAAILAAVMSTADSQLLVTASAITEDFYKAKLRKNASDKELMIVSRLTVLVVSIIAVLIALNPNNTVLGLVENAWAGFGATFGPIMIFSLFWKRTTKKGAIAGLVTGGVTAIVWRNLGNIYGGIFSLYEIVPGFILSAIAIYIVSKLDKEPSKEIQDEFDKVHEMNRNC